MSFFFHRAFLGSLFGGLVLMLGSWAPAADRNPDQLPPIPPGLEKAFEKSDLVMPPADAPVFSLDQCIRESLQQSPAMSSAVLTQQGAEWEVKKTRTNFMPTLSTEYDYTRLDEKPSSSSISSGGILIPSRTTGTQDNFIFQLSVTQPVFTGFSLLSQYRLAELGLDVASIQLFRQKLDLIFQVKQAYYQILEAEKSLAVTRKSEEQLQAHLKVAQSFFEVGLTPKSDVLQAEVNLAEAVQDRILAEHVIQYAWARMNTLMRRPINAPIKVEDIQVDRVPDRTLEEYIELAKANRPEIHEAQRQIEMGEQNVRLSKSDYFPTIGLSYDYTRESDAFDLKDSTYHDANDWSVSAVAQWTLWDWGRTYKKVQTQKAELYKSANTLIEVQDSVGLEVKQNYLAVLAAGKQIRVARKAVEQADENFRMSEERYREQVATNTEVMDAQTSLTMARTNYFKALYGYALAWAALDRALGLDMY